MKRVVRGQELQEKMHYAIDLLGETVKSTLGPKGCNVIIDHSAFSPFITNDGVTIAMNIESDDEVINTILELAKESSIKTNENVGDGTTTTIVLLQGLYQEGMALINKGFNPMLIKKEMDILVAQIVELIQKDAHKPTYDDLKNIAIVSGNSLEIGDLVSEAFFKIGQREGIIIQEGTDFQDQMIFKKGYYLDTGLVSPYYLQGQKEKQWSNVNVLLIKGLVDDFEPLSLIINDLIAQKASLLIIAEDYTDNFINETLSLYLQENINIFLAKLPGYGLTKWEILKDLECIIDNDSYNFDCNLSITNLGKISRLVINENSLTLDFIPNKKVQERIATLEQNKDKNNEELKRRMAMLNQGIIEIQVGATTDVERREKKMRYDDALSAIDAASKGVLPGSGLSLYKAASVLENSPILGDMYNQVLKLPLKQILINAGLNYEEISTEIEKNHFQKLYNIAQDKYEDIKKTAVIDSMPVVINSLVNANSIAGILLTTSSLVINEHESNLKTDLMDI